MFGWYLPLKVASQPMLRADLPEIAMEELAYNIEKAINNVRQHSAFNALLYFSYMCNWTFKFLILSLWIQLEGQLHSSSE